MSLAMGVDMLNRTNPLDFAPTGSFPAKTAVRQGGDFASSLELRIAEIKSQTFAQLLSSTAAGNQDRSAANIDALLGIEDAPAMPGQGSGLSPAGRNTALFDPESAYRMMTTINAKDVTYKAEYAEMHDMQAYLETMQEAGRRLGEMAGVSGNEEIHATLQDFADAYNEWIDRFDDELQSGGLLAGTQAAQVSQWELEQSIENIFNGAGAGVRGMPGLGFTTDPVSNRASIDHAQLDAVLATNKAGALATVREFGANFAKSAELLNAEGNFIPRRLDNLNRAIDFIDNNKASLQAEFGLGDAAAPSGKIAQALAVYNAIHDTAILFTQRAENLAQ